MVHRHLSNKKVVTLSAQIVVLFILYSNFSTFIDFAQIFAIQIARTARDIDAVIESLPNDEQSLELQVN